MIVVDASVAVKWLLPETESGRARKLLAGAERLVVSSQGCSEVSATIARTMQEGTISLEEAQRCMELWRELIDIHLKTEDTGPFLGRAIEIAAACRYPFAGCLTVATAEGLRAKLVTSDAELAVLCKPAYKDIVLLSKFVPA